MAIRSLVLAVMFTGCVFPPSYSVDTTDAALNSPPAIISVRADQTEFPELSTLVFEVGANAGTLNLTLYDTDVDDPLIVRIFIDYNNPDPTPARQGCPSASQTVVRSATCSMFGVCQNVDVGQTRVMQVVVFDRDLNDGQLPLYQAMDPGGLSTTRTFFLKCQAEST